ncbi:hypothetical protein AAU61_17285 [Desulfocarbo indianensis]|nr:hypothetical protein AAU61_17285 [Desulfocarbo indianensis]
MFSALYYLWRLAPQCRRPFMLASLFKLLEALAATAALGVLLLAMDDLARAGFTGGALAAYSGLLAACLLAQLLLFYLFCRLSYPAGVDLAQVLRLKLGEHLPKLSLGFFNSTSVGRLNSVVSDELMMTEHLPTLVLPQLITAAAVPIFTLGLLCWLDWRLFLCALALLPLSLLIFRRGQSSLTAQLDRRSALARQLNQEMVEYIQGMEALQAYNGTGSFLDKLGKLFIVMRDRNIKLARSGPAYLNGGNTVLALAPAAILILGCQLLSEGLIPAPALVSCLVIGLYAYEPLKGLGLAVEIYKLCEPGLTELKKVLDTPRLPTPPRPRSPRSYDIILQDVCFAYESRRVLNHVSFTARAGEITALVGPSGAGKSTLVNLMARMWDVQAGAVLIGGVDLRHMEPAELNQAVSMVFQDVRLFNDTVFNNIALGREGASPQEVRNAAQEAWAHEFIMALPRRYETVIGEGGGRLSRGQRQRIAIARALLKGSPIVLLDEATASLDPESQRMIQQALASLLRGRTAVVIAHRLETITEADSIVVMGQDGEVSAVGNHESLLQGCTLYQELWRARLRAGGWRLGLGRAGGSDAQA